MIQTKELKTREDFINLKKGDVVIIGPYSTVSKDLNSGDKVTTDKKEEKK